MRIGMCLHPNVPRPLVFEHAASVEEQKGNITSRIRRDTHSLCMTVRHIGNVPNIQLSTIILKLQD